MSSQKETNVWKLAMLLLSPKGFRLFRNQRYKGQIVNNGKISKAWADCGVGGDGGADLIGFKIITITQDMVGQQIARFVAIEAKTPTGILSNDQKMFLAGVNHAGGIALVVCDEDDINQIQ